MKLNAEQCTGHGFLGWINLVGSVLIFFFFFQAEDGIRDYKVTGVQTCALPISDRRRGVINVALGTLPPPRWRNCHPRLASVGRRNDLAPRQLGGESGSHPGVRRGVALRSTRRPRAHPGQTSGTPALPRRTRPVSAW